MHRFTFRFFVRLNLMGLAVALAACGGSTNACPSGFVATEGVCLPEPDAGTRVDGATADGDMPDANVADGALADAALDGDLADASPGATTYYVDMDMDGFGDPSTPMDAEVAPDGYVEDATDCDDTAMHVHPGADEVCNGVDDNCDGVVDEDVKTTFYADTDGDTFGDSSSSEDDCTAPDGYVEDATDCDDTARGVHPGATEVCDGVDDDCNGGVDDALAVPSCALSAGVCAGATKTCGGRAGWAACVGTASYGPIYKTKTKTSCDARDNDCDGTVDEGSTCSDGETRVCGMSVGQCRQGTQTCAGGSWASCAGAVGPVAETCNGLDDDCDGATDEDLTPPDICFSAGVCAGTVAVCRGARFVCDYSTVPYYQAGDESRCDGLDNDCDGSTDETLKVTYYRDADGDSFGRLDVTRQACPGSPPSGFVRNSLDCDDSCPTCYTGAGESCDGLDNNCNGVVDEGATLPFYHDLDGDGYGAGAPVQRCSGGSGWASLGGDCWDEGGSSRASAALVHLGQSAYFTNGRADTGGFDYNCSGSDEVRWATGYRCDSSCSGAGWDSTTPACGVSATYRTCGYIGGSCSQTSATRTQECH